MKIEQYLPEWAKKYIKIVYDPVNDWYFSRKYENNDVLLKDIGGTSVSFDTSSDISKKWFYPRYEGEKVHEPVVTNYLIDSLESGDVFFDIGANVGYFSVVAATNGAETHSFEIDPRLGSIISMNLKRNIDSYTVVVAAVSDRPDGVVSFVPHQSDNLSTNQVVGAGHGYCVPTVSIDSYVGSRGAVPNIVKIDVEGSEADVVAGAHETLASDDLRAVLLEIHPELLEDVEEDIRSIYSVFVDRGYSCYRFRDHRSAESDPEILEISLSEVIDLDENEMLFFSRS